ncbi:DUF3696 domain-containing protein [uncultured Brevundimonas sp.]|uniref:AAA family ATPase n=1 Tax=uncultured Brevundimonas sp. TaxID=213418 RepID=UPI0025EA8958|nr:DUF3696 domain-containing protein [uncultured Brevundimonas sp.]
MLKSICVQNYRTFREQFTLDIAPLTILLGANSSGKSSIARLPTLVNQSLSERTSAPILWVSNTLDFGSFSENVHNHDQNGKITFRFNGSFSDQGNPLAALALNAWQSANFSYAIDIIGPDNQSRASKISISIYDETVEMDVKNGFVQSITFRGRVYKELIRNMVVYISDGLFPSVHFFMRDSEGRFTSTDKDILKREPIRILGQYSHANTTDFAISKVYQNYRISTVKQTFEWLKTKSRQVPSLNKKFDQITEAERGRIWLFLFFSGLSSLMTSMSSAVSLDVGSGGYLAPVRAAAERYYRHRELAVDRIDADGSNLAMYLNSLSWMDLDELNNDFHAFFGHKVRVHRSEGHISLRIVGPNNYEDNLADVGFGFSQLIPVMAQIHAASRSLNRSNLRGANAASPIISVEQPELHLHPAFQAQLGVYFARVCQRKRVGSSFRFLIETHSEPLVNEIASMVSKGELSPSDVNIYLFERDSQSNATNVQSVTVNSDGTLTNWPFGFFSSGKLTSPFDRGNFL